MEEIDPPTSGPDLNIGLGGVFNTHQVNALEERFKEHGGSGASEDEIMAKVIKITDEIWARVVALEGAQPKSVKAKLDPEQQS